MRPVLIFLRRVSESQLEVRVRVVGVLQRWEIASSVSIGVSFIWIKSQEKAAGSILSFSKWERHPRVKRKNRYRGGEHYAGKQGTMDGMRPHRG